MLSKQIQNWLEKHTVDLAMNNFSDFSNEEHSTREHTTEQGKVRKDRSDLENIMP